MFPDLDLGEDGFMAVAPVHSFQPNGFGLFNAVGKRLGVVRRLLRPGLARGGKPARSGRTAVMKGGSYLCHESYCWRYRNAARTGTPPENSAGHIGFRVVRDIY